MHHGHYTAMNIHQKMRAELDRTASTKLTELAPVPPTIGLAVGQKAVSYSPMAGVQSGEDVMKVYFGDDLGYGSMCSRNGEWSLISDETSC